MLSRKTINAFVKILRQNITIEFPSLKERIGATMPYFKVDMSRYDFRFPQPGRYMLDVIFENNTKVSPVTHMFPLEGFVVECENKPRDMPFFSIFWLEANLDQPMPESTVGS